MRKGSFVANLNRSSNRYQAFCEGFVENVQENPSAEDMSEVLEGIYTADLDKKFVEALVEFKKGKDGKLWEFLDDRLLEYASGVVNREYAEYEVDRADHLYDKEDY